MARPTFKPTKAQREEVAASKALGMSNDRIALALEISRNTLEKHFANELDIGAAKCQMQVRAQLFKQVRKGNVSAIKHAMTMIDRTAAQAAFEGKQDADPKPEPLGKKAAANEAAKSAGVDTDWGRDLQFDPHRTN